MVINIHAGHNPDGKVACGAVGLIKESTEARKVKNEVVRQLKALGHTVYDCTVDDGTNQSDVLAKIVKKCNAHKADLDVSIHFNAGVGDTDGNGKTSGVEAYVYSASSKAKRAAEEICKAVAEIGFKNRGVKTSTSLYVLRKTNAPSLLVECCFVDDKDDVALYDCKRMASAIVYGITGQQYEDKPDLASDQSAAVASGGAKTVYRVQVGAYATKANANTMRDKLKKAGFDAVVVKV